MKTANLSSSTRPYLIRALYEWCADNGLTPYVAVRVDETVRVPREFVKDGEIVLNISMDATSALKLGNDYIEFKARFAGVARDILIPVARVVAIYARENGQGMAFPPEESSDADLAAHEMEGAAPASSPQPFADQSQDREGPGADSAAPAVRPPVVGRPELKRIK